MSTDCIAKKIASYITASPTPYHAVLTVKNVLTEHGFREIQERDKWQVKPGDKVFFTRRDASIIAFIHGQKALSDHGIRMIGAHTDSPTLKLKPNPDLRKLNYGQLSIEVYGGALLYPWFDRDLSLAGQVTIQQDDKLVSHLIDFKRPVACIPSLAIHLDRAANQGRVVNAQQEMNAIFYQFKDDADKLCVSDLLVQALAEQGITVSAEDVKAFDLSFYDAQAPSLVGFDEQFFASARLDNLLSCFVGLEALINCSGEQSVLLALHDHEEVGSRSHSGADSNMLEGFIDRLVPDAESKYQVLANSVMMSVDNAHGVHPNFASKHDTQHGPILNKGPVIKVDANQSYATTPELAALFKRLAEQAGIPVQTYVTRADMRCGSTIGPMTSANLGLRTIDLGVPTFAMHSVRELSGVADMEYIFRLMKKYSDLIYLTH